MSGRIVPDSNAVVALLAGDASVAARLAAAGEVLLAAAVFGELRYGALNSGRVAENLAKLDELARICRFVPVDETVARTYADMRLSLKRKGRPVPENDIWIAATAKAYDATVLTDDAHFEQFEMLEVERLK